MAAILLSILLAGTATFIVVYMYEAYKKQKAKAEVIEGMKNTGEIRERIITNLYEMWESREDTGLHFSILRDLIFKEMEGNELKRQDFYDEFQTVYAQLIHGQLVSLKDGLQIELTDGGIQYFEKILKK